MVQAYAAVVDDIYTQFDVDTSPVGYVTNLEKLRLLREVLIHKLKYEDYLGLNAARGVNLLLLEPCLESYAQELIPPKSGPTSAINLGPVFTPSTPLPPK